MYCFLVHGGVPSPLQWESCCEMDTFCQPPVAFFHAFFVILQSKKEFFMVLTTMLSSEKKEKVVSFLWQHLLLIASLFVMTAGVAMCVRSSLGSSVISTIPFVFTLAGDASLVPDLTIGQYTYLMNVLLVGA